MINYIFQFWNSLLGKIVRWLLLIPLQSLLLGAYAILTMTVINLILKFFVFSFIYIFTESGFWKFILLVLIVSLVLPFVKWIINIVIVLWTFLGSAVWFLSIKFSPHKQTGKILLFGISIIVTWIILYSIIMGDSHWLFKTLLCLQFLLSFTWLIWHLCLSSGTYDIYDEWWNEWIQKIRKKDAQSMIKISSISENSNLNSQLENTWEVVGVEAKNIKEYYIIPFWRFILLQFLTANFFMLVWVEKNRAIIEGEKYRFNLFRWHPFRIYSVIQSVLPENSFRNTLSIILSIISLVPFLIMFHGLQSDTDWWRGIFAIPILINNFSNLSFGMWIVVIIIAIIFFMLMYSPIVITQYYARKQSKKYGVQEKRLKFWFFEIILYCCTIYIVYLSITDQADDFIYDGTKKAELQTVASWTSYKAKEGTFQIDFPNQNIGFYHSTEKIGNEGTITSLSYTSDAWESVYGIVEYSTENFAIDGEKIWVFPPVVIEGMLGVKSKDQKSENKTTSELEIHRIPGKMAKFEYKQNLIFQDQAYIIEGIVLSTHEKKVYDMYVLYPTINSNVETKRFFDSFKIIP